MHLFSRHEVADVFYTQTHQLDAFRLNLMRTALKFTGVIASILLALTAFLFGWYAARYWSKASKIEIAHDWKMESPDPEWAHEAWIVATVKAVSESSDLNRKAADLTKWLSCSVLSPALLAR